MLLAAESICLGQQSPFTEFDFKLHDAPSRRRHEGTLRLPITLAFASSAPRNDENVVVRIV
jgi:hypothetical protein